MELTSYFLEQLDRQAEACRKTIERVPEGKNAWKPHDRSMDLGYLAALVATMPGWIALMIDRDELDLDGPVGQTFRTQAVETRAELLALLAAGVAKSRRSLTEATEEHLMQPWRLVMNGSVLSEGPRYSVIADGALSHLAHHRGQLTVYLRLLEAKVPAIYGPSADEWHS
jgi:uncharacterized damage-inducible protein DinB